MPSKPIYEYNIKVIEDMQNTKGLSLRAVARALGFPECSMIQWLNRNYNKIIKYEAIN